MNYLIIAALLTISHTSFAQSDVIEPAQLSVKFDSVQISLWDNDSKELSSPADEGYLSKELTKATISRSEANDLLTQLKEEASYDGDRSNLSHHDIEIHFFLNGKKTINVEISAMTGNINISNQLNNYYFRNNCSTGLGKFVLVTLARNDLLERAGYDEMNIEGLK